MILTQANVFLKVRTENDEKADIFMKHFSVSLGYHFVYSYNSRVLLLCVLCYLLCFQLKLRSHCRLLVLCFVWAFSFAFCLYGVASVSSVPAEMSQFRDFTKVNVMWFYVLFGFFFLSWFR